MHFSKTYADLLSSLPQELAHNAINYRQLKKVIKQIVDELESHGLGQAVLQSASIPHNSPPDLHVDIPTPRPDQDSQSLSIALSNSPKIIYELTGDDAVPLKPRLRISLLPHSPTTLLPTPVNSPLYDPAYSGKSVLWAMGSEASSSTSTVNDSHPDAMLISPALTSDHIGPASSNSSELVIPLNSDLTFFTLLTTALEALSRQNAVIETSFIANLNSISHAISLSAKPASEASSHKSGKSLLSNWKSSNDLYLWREVFTAYLEAEIFESAAERDRGERDNVASEERLQRFAQKVSITSTKFSKKSRESLEEFLRMNVYLMNLKKFDFANSEATRKILKKHAKRTALPSLSLQRVEEILPTLHRNTISLPHTLVLAMSEILLPVIPHLDDYECLICTSIAYKPIRLDCGHFYCVRCLVKMQKANKGNCPMCRAPTVITANRANVDYALMRFMVDWFPRETKEKRKSNERESAEEEMREMGLNPANGCQIQ